MCKWRQNHRWKWNKADVWKCRELTTPYIRSRCLKSCHWSCSSPVVLQTWTTLQRLRGRKSYKRVVSDLCTCCARWTGGFEPFGEQITCLWVGLLPEGLQSLLKLSTWASPAVVSVAACVLWEMAPQQLRAVFRKKKGNQTFLLKSELQSEVFSLWVFVLFFEKKETMGYF